MKIVTLENDGLNLNPQATLHQLHDQQEIQQFAEGFIPKALSQTADLSPTLLQVIQADSMGQPTLYTVLLVLDAEIKTVVTGKLRRLPLLTFRSYQQKLQNIQPTAVRLPPLNPDGHYHLETSAEGTTIAVRLDIHPEKGIAGHVRLAVSSPQRPPTRLIEGEARLDWQRLTPDLIDAAIETGSRNLSEPLTPAEQIGLREVLRRFV